MRNCIFCEEGNDFSYCKSFLGKEWIYNDRVVYHNRFVFAVVGYGPQVDPYIIIIPYRHMVSLSQMNDDEWSGFKECLTFLCNRGGFGEKLCIFEHGGKAGNNASIDHCHIHVISGDYNLYYDDSFSTYNNLPSLHSPREITGSDYLLIGEFSQGNLEIKISYDQCKNEHQYFRKRLSVLLNSNYWDWHQDSNLKMMSDTMKKFTMDFTK